MENPEDVSNPTTALDMALKLVVKAFQLNNSTPTNNNQRSSSNPCNGQIAQLARDEANGNGINENQIRCYNCQGVDHYASNCIVKPRKQDAAYLQKQMQISQKEEAGIQLTSEEFDFMAAVGACEETVRANANCTLENNLQQTSTFGTQSDKAPVYDSDESAEVHLSKNCYDNAIFNMFTQEEQYTKLLKPIPEPHQVQQNDSNVIYVVSSVKQGGGIIEQHSATVEETHAKFVRDFKSLAKEANESLVKHKALELEIERLLRAVVDETNNLSNLVTSNSVPTTKESKVVENDKMIASGIFRINPFKASRVDNFMPNKHVKASVTTKPITVSQPHVITKNDVNSKTNGFSPKDVKSTTMTRRPLPRNNPKNDKVHFKSKSSWLLNNLEKIEENHRNLQSSLNRKHMSSKCNNIKLAIQNAKYEVVCAMCKQV
nr:hypothetical protein [Tanacetum cinerariifolium]